MNKSNDTQKKIQPNLNWPSKSGNPSGGNRSNNPPKTKSNK